MIHKKHFKHLLSVSLSRYNRQLMMILRYANFELIENFISNFGVSNNPLIVTTLHLTLSIKQYIHTNFVLYAGNSFSYIFFYSIIFNILFLVKIMCIPY
jgi:hypothetical protein